MKDNETKPEIRIHDKVLQEFVWIEPGTFMMGSPEDEPYRFSDETQHEVTIKEGFFMADTTCTQALWQAVMGDNPSYWKGDNLPVHFVSWNDAKKFIAKLNEMFPDWEFNLPTEEEWEYACRAGTTTAYSFGDTVTKEQVNFYETGKENKLMPVKSYPPNPWGLYDMHGNVWEWTDSDYIPNK